MWLSNSTFLPLPCKPLAYTRSLNCLFINFLSFFSFLQDTGKSAPLPKSLCGLIPLQLFDAINVPVIYLFLASIYWTVMVSISLHQKCIWLYFVRFLWFFPVCKLSQPKLMVTNKCAIALPSEPPRQILIPESNSLWPRPSAHSAGCGLVWCG